MKAYFIFAIALTVAYIIYYAVMIARDLYGKNGEKIKSGEEEFDVSDFDEEESVSVVENDKGFNIGDNEYETHYINETRNVSGETNHADEKPKQHMLFMYNTLIISVYLCVKMSSGDKRGTKIRIPKERKTIKPFQKN